MLRRREGMSNEGDLTQRRGLAEVVGIQAQ
jgi:hypothetical protein